jgi:hypothetical protein
MKTPEVMPSSGFRYHTKGPDGLFQPIVFAFVTEEMCGEILAERELILKRTLAELRARQRSLFEAYDPTQRVQAFRSILGLFSGDAAGR